MASPTVTIEEAMRTALVHHKAGRLHEAELLYRQVLTRQPDHAGGLHYLGLVALQTRRFEAAVGLISRSLRIDPPDPVACFNLGEALFNLRCLPESISAYERAVALRPDYAKAHESLGHARLMTAQYQPAIASYERAIALQPDLFAAWNNACAAWKHLGELDRALAAGQRAVALQPDSHEAHNNLANALKETGQLEQAIGHFERATALAPDNPVIHSNLILTLHYHPHTTALMIEAEHQRWNARHADGLRSSRRPHANDPDPARRLKVGYVSPDFRTHAISAFFLPLLEAHDWAKVKVHCFASVSRPDAVTKRIQQRAGVWHDVHGLSDAAVAERIRAAEIDILVDLSMHTAHNRLPVFARRPAPVQVAWLAYAGTSGLKEMDYRLTDAWMEPPDRDAERSAEERVRLPDSWCCYHPLDQKRPVGGLPALRPGAGVTFGSLNNFSKVSDEVLGCWAGVLRAVPGSRLLLNCPLGERRQHVLALLGRGDIEAGRVEFVARMSRDEYFHAYQQIDLALDPFPFSGMTTTCDALWMGVPVLTRYGEQPASRASLSLLTCVGLPELAVPSEELLVKAAVNLADDLPRLAQLRSGLRARMKASPLMDAPCFARNVEAAYRVIWRRWCEGEGAREKI